MNIRAVAREIGHGAVRVVAEVGQQVDPVGAAAVRVHPVGHHRTVAGRAGGVGASPAHERGEQLHRSQKVKTQMKRKQRLEVLDQHGARHVRLVGEQAQRVVGQQISLTDAEWRLAIGLVRLAYVHGDLPVEVQQRLRLDIDSGRRIVPIGVRVHSREEEAPESVAGGLPASPSRVVEHPVDLLGGAVIPRVPGVAELVRVAVQRSRRGQGLIRLAPIHHVHEIRLDPALDDVGMLVEADEAARVLGVLVSKVVDGEFVPARGASRPVAFEPQPGEQHGQHPVHVDRLEVDVRELVQAKLPVASLQRHQTASASIA